MNENTRTKEIIEELEYLGKLNQFDDIKLFEDREYSGKDAKEKYFKRGKGTISTYLEKEDGEIIPCFF